MPSTHPDAASSLPIAVIGRTAIDAATRSDARARLERKLRKHAAHVQRVSVRFDDLNGPRGGVDTRCRIKVVVTGLPSILVEARATDARRALLRAADAVERAVRRSMQRHGRSSPSRRGRDGANRPDVERPRAGRRDDEGSLIGRRVGRSRENLARALARPEKRRRDAYVDTAAPGVSASDRKAGYGATAARNTRARTSGMTATLEDSRTRPSRKSTRRSSNRSKAATAIARQAGLRPGSPKARARRAQARRSPRR